MIPSAIISVKKLGISAKVMSIIVVSTETGYEVKESSSPSEFSMCPKLSVSIPTVVFLAEIFDASNGQFLARIDEKRHFAIKDNLKINMVTMEWEPIYIEKQDPDSFLTHTYISDWESKSVVCENIEKQLSFLEEVAMYSIDYSSVNNVINSALDKCYK